MERKGTAMNERGPHSTKWSLWKWVLAGWLCLSPAGTVPAQPNPANHHPGRILVKPRPGVNLTLLHAQAGVLVWRIYPAIGNLQVVQLPPLADPLALIALYRQSGLVAYAEPDFVLRTFAPPNDPRYLDGSLWGLHNIGQNGGRSDADIDAPEAWDVQTSAAGIIVAVIDTGVRPSHQDLAANLWVNPGENGGFLFLDRRSNLLDDDGNGYIDDVHGIDAILGLGLVGFGVKHDDNGHGTHVSGTIGAAGNNGAGITGVAWRTRLMNCRFLNAAGTGFTSDAIECINYARHYGAHVINASWGGTEFSEALRDAIASARDAGMIFVAAAGNDSTDNDTHPLYPAAYDLDNILSVAATDRNDNLASFSNRGANSVDLGAPGHEILSTWNLGDTSYMTLSGTSMAAPHVAGACALVWARHPGETYRQIIQRVLSSVDPLPALAGRTRTGGRLNLSKALLSAGAGGGSGSGDFTSGLLRIAVPSEPRVSLLGVGSTPEPAQDHDGFRLQLEGTPDTNYRIEGSPDLVSWTTVATHLTDANGTAVFADPRGQAFEHQFYRAVRAEAP
jgi:subtilisin family serine protease